MAATDEDPIRRYIASHPTSVAASLLNVVVLDEEGHVAQVDQRMSGVDSWFDRLTFTSPFDQLAMLAQGFDVAIDILHVSARDSWVNRYGAYAEKLGRILSERLHAAPLGISKRDENRIARTISMTGMVERADGGVRIFDRSHPRTGAQLEKIMRGGNAVPSLSNLDVELFLLKLEYSHPVNRLFRQYGSTGNLEAWALPFVDLHKPNGAREAEQKMALLVEGLVRASDDHLSGDFPTQLDSVERLVSALYETSQIPHPRERALAIRAMNYTGRAIDGITTVLPYVFGAEATQSLWVDGTIEYKGGRVQIPGMTMTINEKDALRAQFMSTRKIGAILFPGDACLGDPTPEH